MITPSVVLNAKRWSSLGLPKTPEGLRTAQRSVHPDEFGDVLVAADGPDRYDREWNQFFTL